MLTCGSIEDINKSCLEQFRAHWQCLENNNQQLWQCRPAEWKLNKCVYENLVRLFYDTECWQGTSDQILMPHAEPREDHPRPAQAIDPRTPQTQASVCPQVDPPVGAALYPWAIRDSRAAKVVVSGLEVSVGPCT